jgi:hypothetical protein
MQRIQSRQFPAGNAAASPFGTVDPRATRFENKGRGAAPPDYETKPFFFPRGGEGRQGSGREGLSCDFVDSAARRHRCAGETAPERGSQVWRGGAIPLRGLGDSCGATFLGGSLDRCVTAARVRGSDSRINLSCARRRERISVSPQSPLLREKKMCRPYGTLHE